MSTRRVVITGMGWVTPLGDDVDQVWQRLLRAQCAVQPVTRFDAGTFATNFAAQSQVPDLATVLGPDAARAHAHAGTSSRFALTAAQRAWNQAGLDPLPKSSRERMGIYLGAGEGRTEPAPVDNRSVHQ